MATDDRRLWQLADEAHPGVTIECVMVSCCSGAELQVRRTESAAEPTIVLRELYPTKSDLYERARMLAREYARQ